MRKKLLVSFIAIFVMMGSVFAQTRTLTGTVTSSEDGSTLPGVTVIVKETQKASITDEYGKYRLTVAPEAKTLVFSFLGMMTQEVTIGSQTTINAILKASLVQVDEVVVTAFGISKEKKALGFAADQISGVELMKSKAPNLVSALSGKSAGVFVSASNSIEGGSSKIVIRGNSTINGMNQPLIIVDGMPLNNDSEATGAFANRDYGSGINYINQDDVESMTILKGPAATALYGSRGSNGVIIVTSKKGKGAKRGLGVEYSYTLQTEKAYKYQDMQNEYGMGGPSRMLWAPPALGTNADGELMYPNGWSDVHGGIPAVRPNGNNYNSWDLFSWYTPAASWGPALDGSEIRWWDGEMRSWSPQPDNQRGFYQTGVSNTHSLSLTNVSDMGNFRVSLTNTDNKAVIPNSGFNRSNIYIGGDLKISDKVRVEITTSFNQYTRHNAPKTGGDHQGTFNELMYGISRDYQAFDWDEYQNEDGSMINYSKKGWPYWYMNNIGWEYKVKDRYQYRKQLRSNVNLIYDVFSWWKVSGSVGTDFTLDEREDIIRPTDVDGLVGGNYSHSMRRYSSPTMRFLSTMHKESVIEGLDVSFTTGAESVANDYYTMSGSTSRAFKDPFIYSFANYAVDPKIGNAIPKETRFQKQINSVFGFVDFSYRKFIYLNISGRNDWSSTLPIDNNSYFYPSISLSVIPTEVLDLPDWVSFTKFRIGYAMSGSDTNPYLVVPTYTPGSYAGSPTLSITRNLPPPVLRPQRAKSFETGFNVAFLNNRINVDVTYYNTYSYDQIMSSPLPSSSGASSITFNSGELQLEGVEFSLHGVLVETNDLRWSLGVTGSRSTNKLISLTEGVDEYIVQGGDMWGEYGTLLKVIPGENYGVLYGWGIAEDPNGNKILDVYHDADGNVTGTLYRKTDEMVPVGNITPKMRGGFNTQLNYKSFNLYALVDYKWGGDVFNAQYGSALVHGLSPATLVERNGAGLPFTYPDGSTENIGVLLDGVVETSAGVYEANTHVVHAFYKYAQNGWNKAPQPQAVMDNSWVKLREVSLSYDLPQSIVSKLGIFKSLNVSLVGRNLFYLYSNLPDNINPEGINGVGNNQAMLFGSLPGFRSIAFTLRAGF